MGVFVEFTGKDGLPVFIRPEFVMAYGPSHGATLDETPKHNTWITLHGDAAEIYVVETCEEVGKRLVPLTLEPVYTQG